MNKMVFAFLIAACSAVPALAAQGEAAAETVAVVGKTLFDANGKNVGVIYKVTSDGSAQLVIDDQRLITVPASSLSQVDGKIRTSLTKRDIVKPR